MADLSVMSFLNEETQQETEYNIKDAQARTDIGTINGKIPSAASSSNKLVDTTAMNDAIGQAVSAAYKPAGNKTVAELTSSLLVAANRGKVYNMTDAGTTTADFVEGAGHPIRIGDDVGICEPTTGTFKFNLLSGFIAVDTNPTQSSTNPVSSGGVYTALDGKISKSSSAGYVKNDGSIDTDLATTVANKVDKVTGKGLSTNDYDNTAKTVVTTAQDNIIANTKLIKDTVGWSGKNLLEIKAVTRTLNGVTLTIKDGIVTLNGTATASNQVNLNDTSGLLNSLTQKYGDLILNGSPALTNCRLYTHINGGSYVTSSNEDETPILASTDYDQTILLQFDNGATFNNVQFKPMLRPKYILDNSFEPYFGSTAFPRSEQAVLGAKNRYNNANTNGKPGSVLTKTDTGFRCVVSTDSTWNGATNELRCSANVGFKLSLDTAITSGITYITVAGSTDGTNYTNIVTSSVLTESGNVNLEFNTGNYTYLRITFFTTNATVKTCDVTISNIMLYDSADPDPTYAPYAMTNKELTDKMFLRSEQVVLGAKNLLDISKRSANTATFSSGGVTFNDDGTIVVNGVVSAEGSIVGNMPVNIPNGKYKLSGCTGGSFNTYLVDIYETQWTNRAICYDGDTDFEFTQNVTHYMRIWLKPGTYNNLVFKPMIRLATDMDGTYVPRVLTNKELTESVKLTHLVNAEVQALFNEDSDLTDFSGVVNKFGRVVTGRLQFKLAKTTVDTTINLLTLPDELKPIEAYAFTTYDAGSGSTNEHHDVFLNASGSGQLYLRNSHDASRWIVFNFTYISAK